MVKESVEALLNPSLKVSRPVAACARCRSAKIKCTFTGKSAACSSCERAGKGKECSSATDEFARGKERSYTSALESAIQHLQKKIDDVKHGGPRDDHMPTFENDRPSFHRRPISNNQRREAGSVDELVSDFGFLTVNATSRDFQGFASTMSFAKMLKAISTKESLPTFEDTSLPPRQTASQLTNYYFENIYVLLPFLSETEFMSSVSRVYQEGPNMGGASPFELWCFHLVMAISSASLCEMRGDENYSVAIRNISAAMAILEHVIHPGSLSGVQALLLLVQYALVDPEYLDSWYLVGMASRLVVDLGLHCEPAAETKVSKRALDLRRRIFYCTFALDRLVSMSLGYAFSFTDDSAPNVLLPTLATDQESRSPTQLFLRSVRPSLFLFDIRRVQSGFYQRTRWSARREWDNEAVETYIAAILDDIRNWHGALPDHFSPKLQQGFYLEYLYSQVLTLSPNQAITSRNISDTNKILLFEMAISYSDQLRLMLGNSSMRSCLNYADCCRARFVARQFQALMWADFDLLTRNSEQHFGVAMLSNDTTDSYARAINFLDNMSQIFEWPKRRWGISALQEIFAQESAVLLARLKTRQQEALSQASSPQQSYSANSSVLGQISAPVSPYDTLSLQNYNPSLQPGHNTFSNDASLYNNPALHRSNLLSSSQWPAADGQHLNPELPPGSLPRRGYMFSG